VFVVDNQSDNQIYSLMINGCEISIFFYLCDKF